MEICDLGQRPPLGEVPEKMHAMVIRQDRYGEPDSAFQREVIPTPEIGPLDVLVYVMATGINYNNVWGALGDPLDVIAERQRKGEPEDFHAGGSDCSGIVWKVGESVTDWKPGDEVVVHSGWWEPEDPWVLSGSRPDAGREHAYLGIPDQLRELLSVRPRAVPPMSAQTQSPDLGGGGLLPSVRLDRLPDADGLVAQYSRRG